MRIEKTVSKDEFLKNKSAYLKKIANGAVFIYPTDTIYGIGCDATNKKAVERIKKIKDRFQKPFSVIAPSLDWIKENCEVFGKAKDELKKLPGAYTFIFALKVENCVAEAVNLNSETLGVRLPLHWFTAIVKELDVPFVTTSVNKAGRQFMTSLDNLDESIKEKVDFIIYEGKKDAKPSTVINLIDGEAVVER
ncbi:threonylcarbamoyl-AMP synthase [Candidatus Woesearchaeota archaeon]|nr:threonylcarbamoyl-AMP synthase [Candidatus Woesearchaeota archaeon]